MCRLRFINAYPDTFESVTFSFRIQKFSPSTRSVHILIRCRIHRIRVDGSRQYPEENNADSKISRRGASVKSRLKKRVQLPQGHQHDHRFIVFGTPVWLLKRNTTKILYHFGTACCSCYFHSELSITSRVRARYFRESLPL